MLLTKPFGACPRRDKHNLRITYILTNLPDMAPYRRESGPEHGNAGTNTVTTVRGLRLERKLQQTLLHP